MMVVTRGGGIAAFFIGALLGALLGAVPAPAAAQVGSPAGPVPPERLAARREALLDRLGTGVAVLRSSGLRSIEGDYPQDSDFRQENDFFYLTGLEVADSWLVLVAREDGPDVTILYLPARDPAAERWTGPRLGPGPEATALSGIRDVRPVDRAPAELGALLAGPDSPARVGGAYARPDAARFLCLAGTPNHANAGCEPGVEDASVGSASVELRDLRPHVAALRIVKDSDELVRLRRAIEITTEAHREAMRAAKPGLWEYELEALIEYTFRRRGAERVGFPSIVGSGPNSTVLHYDRSRRRMEAGDLVVVDIGAEFGYYSADITRTIPVSGRFTERQRALYDLVLGAQQAAIDSVRPGVTIADLTRIARQYMRENSGDLCGAVSCERHFVHGLSHWLGMDVHDVGDYRTPLAPGMVLTVEPGLYLPDEGIGIRIEDDILVTANGSEILSAAPRTVREIERAMAGATTMP